MPSHFKLAHYLLGGRTLSITKGGDGSFHRVSRNEGLWRPCLEAACGDKISPRDLLGREKQCISYTLGSLKMNILEPWMWRMQAIAKPNCACFLVYIVSIIPYGMKVHSNTKQKKFITFLVENVFHCEHSGDEVCSAHG